MRIAGSIITLICGIVVVVGVFLLAWMNMCEQSWLGYQCLASSGWDMTSLKAIFADEGISSYMLASLGYNIDMYGVYLVLGGGALMAVCALPAFIVSLATKGGKAAVLTLSILAIVGALVAIGGCVWYIISALDVIELTSLGGSFLGIDSDCTIYYGFYITAAAAVLGLVFAILTAAFAKGKQDW